MKKLTLALLALMLGLMPLAYGQIEPDHVYNLPIFEEVGHTNNLVYSFNHRPKVYDTQYLTLFDSFGKETTTIEVKAKQGMELAQHINVGKKTVFYFVLNYSKDILLLVVDENGQEVTRKQVTYLKFFGSKIVPAGDNRFYLVADVKEKKQGIQVECFDLGLNSLWVYNDFPEKGRYYFDQAAVNSKGEAAILYTFKNQDFRLLTLTAEGKPIANQIINTGELKHYTPYRMDFLADDECFVFADYGTSTEEAHMTTPIGLNIKKFNLNGEEIQNNNFGFENLISVLPMHANNPPRLRIVDIQKIDNKDMLVLESYIFSKRSESKSTNSQTPPTTISYKTMELKSIYLVDLNSLHSAGKYIWKSDKSITIDGINYYDATDFCDLLQEKNAFGYQGLSNGEILISGIGQNHVYFNRVPLNEKWEDVTNRTYFGKPVSDKPGNRKPALTYSRSSGVGPIKGIQRMGWLPTADGWLFYRYNRSTSNLEFTVIH